MLTITGCGGTKNRVNNNNKESRAEMLKRDLEVRCSTVEEAAYSLYKQNHTNKIIAGVCCREDQREYSVYFSAGDNLLYKYVYDITEGKIITPDNDNYHTEKLDEYAKKCEDYDADGRTKATCTNHKYMLREYQEYVAGITERPTVFKSIDLSKLK